MWYNVVVLFFMSKKKESKLKVDTTEPVRIDKEIVGMVRAQKRDDDGLGVGKFFEVAAKEKLAKKKVKNDEKI